LALVRESNMSKYWAALALVLALGPLAATQGPDRPVPLRREPLEVVRARNEVARLQEENKKLLAELAKYRAVVAALRADLADLRSGAKKGKPGGPALPKDKWDLSDVEKSFPDLRFKSVLYTDKEEAKVTLQFTGEGPKDFGQFSSLGADKERFAFLFMDEEGVPLKTAYHDRYEGSVYGLRKGDAFRLIVKLPEPALWKQIVKIEVRDKAPSKRKP
jgi:hypothetical protein